MIRIRPAQRVEGLSRPRDSGQRVQVSAPTLLQSTNHPASNIDFRTDLPVSRGRSSDGGTPYGTPSSFRVPTEGEPRPIRHHFGTGTISARIRPSTVRRSDRTRPWRAGARASRATRRRVAPRTGHGSSRLRPEPRPRRPDHGHEVTTPPWTRPQSPPATRPTTVRTLCRVCLRTRRSPRWSCDGREADIPSTPPNSAPQQEEEGSGWVGQARAAGEEIRRRGCCSRVTAGPRAMPPTAGDPGSSRRS